MCWTRARSNEQKEQRINEIVEATARLFENHSFEEISFALIAKEAKFTRSNLYKYFQNKEEIFLTMLAMDIHTWQLDSIQALSPYETIDTDSFTDIWCEVFIKQKRMVDLFTILFTFLEKNASIESIMCFKKAILYYLNIIVERLCVLFPSFTSEKAGKFIHLQLALSVGLYPMANLSEKQLKAIELAELDYTPPPFLADFKLSVKSILQGLLNT